MQVNAEDLIIWPCDTWCYRYELPEFSHKSDDYKVVRTDDPEYGYTVTNLENM